MENSKIFRKKSLERISTPDDIDDYIKTTTPGVWMILVAILLILFGTLIWSVFGQITVETVSGAETVRPIAYLLP